MSKSRAKKKLMNELIPPNSNPIVKTIVTSALTAIIEHYNVTRPQTETDSGFDMTGMTREQAEQFIDEVKTNLDMMLGKVEFKEVDEL